MDPRVQSTSFSTTKMLSSRWNNFSSSTRKGSSIYIYLISSSQMKQFRLMKIRVLICSFIPGEWFMYFSIFCSFNWGLSVQKLSERVLNLLEDRQFWQEERTRARKLTRGIQGFGSFCQRPCSLDADLQNASVRKMYGRWNSHGNYNVYNQEDELLVSNLEETCREGNNRSSEPERRQVEVKCLAVKEDHPFCDNELRSTESLLSKKLK